MVSAQDISQQINDDLVLLTSCECSGDRDYGVVSQRLIGNIEKFEQDPSVLGRALPSCLRVLTHSARKLVLDPVLLGGELLGYLARVYYTFDKVFGWKKMITLLQVDMDILHTIIDVLCRDNAHSWYVDYFLLSWLYVILLSPFRFEKDGVDVRVLQLLQHRGFAENNLYSGIVANISAELCYKNKSLLQLPVGEHFSTAQLLSLNYFLKRVISSNLAPENTHFLSENRNNIKDAIMEIQIRWHHGDGVDDEQLALCMTKIMPKLFYVELYYENWSELEYIISWYLLNLNSRFTEVRYAHAHSFKKVLAIIATYMDVTIAAQLTENIVLETLQLIKYSSESIDVDKFHSYLILIAEVIGHVIDYLPPRFLGHIVEDILPVAFNFQVMNHMGLVSQRGNQIKDTANFVCWSLVRNRQLRSVLRKNSDLCQSVFPNIFIPLLVNSLFDNDFIVRKSSNAALQEFLGRIATFNSIHGLALDSTVVMKLLELKYSDLTTSYNENLVLLAKIFHDNHRWLSDVLHWFVHFNILKNLDLKIVKSSIDAFGTFANSTTTTSTLVTVNDVMNEIPLYKNMSSLQCARLLHMCVKIRSTLRPDSVDLYCLCESIIHSHFNISRRNEEYFKYLTVLMYWRSNMEDENPFTLDTNKINFLFEEVVKALPTKNVCSWFDDISLCFNSIVDTISHGAGTVYFQDDDTAAMFWSLYSRYLKFNNELICSSVPMLQTSDFINKIIEYQTILTCQAKASILSTLNRDDCGLAMNRILSDDQFIHAQFIQLLKLFLRDHTITDQGDVGRLVRFEACLLVQKHIQKFDHGEVQELCLEILFLLAEPSEEISHLCLDILQHQTSMYNRLDGHLDSHDLKILRMKDIFLSHTKLSMDNLKENSITFWKHFSLRAGAIHSTDSQIQTAVDAFATWYRSNLHSTEDQMKIFHELIIAIPSASAIVKEKREYGTSNSVKEAVTSLNFISRVISTRVSLYTSNWDGILAKMHNLVILKGSGILKTTIVKFLPNLATAYITVTLEGDTTRYVNKIIHELVSVLGRLTGSDNEPITTIAIQGLVQIYLECGKYQEISRLKPLTNSAVSIQSKEPSHYYIDT